MTRRTQKSYKQYKKQSTRKRGGTYGKRGKWIWTVYCIMRDGIEQCFRKRTLQVNNTKNNNNTKKRKQKEQENRNELEAYYRYS